MLLKYTIPKFTLSGDLVVHYCADAFSVSYVCMQLSQHRRFDGCGLGAACVASSLPLLALIFSRKVPNKGLDLFGVYDVQLNASTFVEAMEELDLRRRIEI